MDIINRIKYICFTPNNIIKPLDLKHEALLEKPRTERHFYYYHYYSIKKERQAREKKQRLPFKVTYPAKTLAQTLNDVCA